MIDWNKDSLKQNLGYKFLKEVKNKMREDDTSVVKFGTTGDGSYPNYQITHSKYPDRPRTIRGRNHEKFDIENEDEFQESNLSDNFSYSEICNLVNELG